MTLRRVIKDEGLHVFLNKGDSRPFLRFPSERTGLNDLSSTFAGVVDGLVAVTTRILGKNLWLDLYNDIIGIDETEVGSMVGVADTSRFYLLQRGKLLDAIWEPKETCYRKGGWLPEPTVWTSEGNGFLRADKYTRRVAAWKELFLLNRPGRKRFTPELVRVAIKLGIEKHIRCKDVYVVPIRNGQLSLLCGISEITVPTPSQYNPNGFEIWKEGRGNIASPFYVERLPAKEYAKTHKIPVPQ